MRECQNFLAWRSFFFTFSSKYAILNLIILWHSVTGERTYSKEGGLSTGHLSLAITGFYHGKAYLRYALNQQVF